MTLASPSISLASLPHYRFTADQYHRMIESGVLTKDDRCELLDGHIVDMPPMGLGQHSMILRLFNDVFRSLNAEEVILSVKGPVLLDDRTEPAPHLRMLKFREDFYGKKLAGPEDILLLIEVVDSSIGIGPKVKVPLYARAGIVEVWIVDVNAKSIEVYREPAEGRYRQVQTIKGADEVSPLAFAGVRLSVNSLFPG
jgi:Uma2 family endonuclease